MLFKICCVGKLKDSFYISGCDEYIRRLSRFAKVQVLEVQDEKIPDSASPAEEIQIRDKEGAKLLAKLQLSDYVIALCPDGKRMTSERFAGHLQALADSGRSSIAFVIGGSIGLSDAILSRSNERLSLSDMTMPHRLCRLFLLEQLYRACKINAGERYHK